MAVRLEAAASQLLMPLVFSAHAGSLLALTGTPVNVLVSEAAVEAGLPRFGFFEFTLVGVPLLAGHAWRSSCCSGSGCCPSAAAPSMPADFSRHAKTLVEQYGLADGLFQLRVRATSPYVGTAALGDRPRAYRRTAARRRPGGRHRRAAAPRRRWPRATILLVRGDAEAAAAFAAEMHLAFREEDAAGGVEETLFNRSPASPRS